MDTYEVWVLLKEREIEGVIPPQENAIYWVDENDELPDLDRNRILGQIEKEGRKIWKQESGYHRRSLSEAAMLRFKIIFGPELYSRKLRSQQTEAAIKVLCLNKMTGVGMPISEKARLINNTDLDPFWPFLKMIHATKPKKNPIAKPEKTSKWF
ncbi:MAG: hypothetical protein WA004_05570 [Saprospiraceae bacterium]